MTERAPRLVLLPGLDGTGRLFAPLLRRLPPAAGASVIPYPTDRPLDYARLAAFVRERLPARSEFVLVAESFAGPLAVALAAQDVAGLRGLVLAATFTSFEGTVLRAGRWLVPRVSPHAVPIGALSWLLMGPHATPELTSELAAALASVPADVLRARAAAALVVDVRLQAQSLGLPVLFLRPQSDRLFTSGVYRATLASLPAARVCAVDGPHFLLQTRPEACADEILRFVRESCTASESTMTDRAMSRGRR